MSRTANKPMCVVTIGFTSLLMPAADGARLMTMLGQAVEVDNDYRTLGHLGGTWVVSDKALRLEMEMVRADRVKMPEGSVQAPHGQVKRLR